MSKPSPARYRTTNWSSYTASLCKRGSLLIWLDKDMTWLAPPDGKPGRPSVFSDAAIQFCLTIKVLFKLPLRQTTGMVASLLKMADLDWTIAAQTLEQAFQKSEIARIERNLIEWVPAREFVYDRDSFRRMLGELSTLMAYEITRDFPLQDLEIETPMEKMVGKVIDGRGGDQRHG